MTVQELIEKLQEFGGHHDVKFKDIHGGLLKLGSVNYESYPNAVIIREEE